LNEELETLKAKQEQQQFLNDQADVLQVRGTAVEFVRNTIKAAGPEMTKRLVQIVGAEANRIFGDIMGDYSTTLEWHEDYAIGAIKSGEERDFRLLSGGEQMVAAIAIRLALLTHLSEIRFAFFDEPTVNLDGTRRLQLAQHLNAIKNLQQVFVISHDDTFEEDCEHVVFVEKIDGLSRVEVR
jgi:exonuclease SbcC